MDQQCNINIKQGRKTATTWKARSEILTAMLIKIHLRDGTASDVAEMLHAFFFRVKQFKKKSDHLTLKLKTRCSSVNYLPVNTE